MNYNLLDKPIKKKREFFKASEARNIMRESITIKEKEELKKIIDHECNNGNTDTIMYKSYTKNMSKKLFLEEYGYYVSIQENYLIISWSSKELNEFNINKIIKYD
jgi:hypothetical protein